MTTANQNKGQDKTAGGENGLIASHVIDPNVEVESEATVVYRTIGGFAETDIVDFGVISAVANIIDGREHWTVGSIDFADNAVIAHSDDFVVVAQLSENSGFGDKELFFYFTSAVKPDSEYVLKPYVVDFMVDGVVNPGFAEDVISLVNDVDKE